MQIATKDQRPQFLFRDIDKNDLWFRVTLKHSCWQYNFYYNSYSLNSDSTYGLRIKGIGIALQNSGFGSSFRARYTFIPFTFCAYRPYLFLANILY